MTPIILTEYRIIAAIDGEIYELEQGFINRADAERAAESYRRMPEYSGHSVTIEEY